MALNILFVDDEPQMLKYFDRALSDEFSVITANGVSEAIEILQQRHEEIAVVMTDQRMPERLGMELLQYTHQHHPRIIRMLTTAFCEIDNAIDAINKAEVFRYIQKPWDFDDLTNILSDAIDRYHSSLDIKSKVSNAADLLLAQLKDDCESWHDYAAHAYGDVDVYRSGIEALANTYYRRTQNNFEKNEIEAIQEKVDQFINTHFLNRDIMMDMQAQEAKGFGFEETTTASNKNLH